MRMSHVYQPVMLGLLLGRNGRASVQDVARALLNEDRSQLNTIPRSRRTWLAVCWLIAPL